MKTRFLFLIILMNCTNAWSQDSTTVTIKTGYKISDVLKENQIYLNPQFIPGEVIFRDNTKARARMNYNSLFDQMLFINEKGDTLAIKDEKNIHHVALDKDTFYYEDGFKKIVGNDGRVMLAERGVWELGDIRKIGSHNREANTYLVDSYKTVTDDLGRTLDLVLNEDVVLRKNPTFFFGDKFGHFLPASKKNLFLSFPNDQNRISEYLKKNKVNFNNREDIVRLTKFLAQKS